MTKTLSTFVAAITLSAFIPTVTLANSGDFSGGVAIGAGYAGVDTAPANGLAVQGKVGIGTTSPGYLLDVESAGTTGSNEAVFLQAGLTTGDTTAIYTGKSFSTNQSANFAYTYNSSTPNLSYASLGVWGTSYTLNVTGQGNVGIDTTNPAYTLQVAGSVAGSSAYVNTSDSRYKKNIEPLQLGLHEVEQLRPVSFEWKDPKDPGMKGQQIGLVAQDVEKILPSVVLTEDNPEKTKAMKYSELIPVLIKAIQEQQKEIDALKQTAKQRAGAQ